MGSATALSGLASGVDTSGIIDQLMAVERQQAIPINNQQTRVTAQQSALKAIAAKLTAFQSAVDALNKQGTAFAQSQAVNSSDTNRVQVAKISGAGIGGHTIQVDRLAASFQDGFVVGDLSSGGTIQIKNDATKSIATITYGAKTTAASLVDQINADGTAPVYAALVKNAQGEDRLVLSARTTGESSRFTVTAAALTEDIAYASPPIVNPADGSVNPDNSLNAKYEVDGKPGESETNSIENGIAGLRLTLKGVTSSPVSVTVDPPDIDRDAVKDKIKAVVDAYNSLVTTTRGELDEKRVVDPQTTTDLGAGTLFGDISLTSMLSSMRNGLRKPIGDLTGVTKLADLGIDIPAATGAAPSDDAKQGKFTLDEDKLDAALDSDWSQVADFMDNFASKVDDLVKAQTGGTNSLIDGRVASDDKQLGSLSDQLDRLNTRLDAEQTRLQVQFASMETALSQLQSQQAWLTGQINSLPQI